MVSRVADLSDRVSVVGVSVSVFGLLGGLGVLGQAYWRQSVWFTLLAVGGPALAVFVVGWNAADIDHKTRVVQQVKVGLVAGVGGLVVYDLVRWSVVWVTGVSINLFEAFPVFGELLVGSGASTGAVWAAGVGYHVFNGLGFAVFFSIFWGRKGVIAGVGWAFLLEIATLLVYPGWLDIRAKGEFTVVSMAGHVGYGLAIGYICKRLQASE